MEEIKPDIKYENNYIRIVYEVITTNLRTNKKIIEKEINNIVNKVSSIKKKPGSLKDSLVTIKSLIKKSKELQEKVKSSITFYINILFKYKHNKLCIEEDNIYDSLRERFTEIKLIEADTFTYDNLRIFCEKKINNLMLDFFLREKYLESAKNYIADEKINVFL